MSTIEIGPLDASEVAEAWRIVNLAFGTFLRVPDPSRTFGDRDLLPSRFRSAGVEVLAARDNGKLVGSNVATRWGSFGFFGPLTVLPEYWDKGVAQMLLERTTAVFERWGVRHSGLFTFAESPKHIGLYQKFGYWPQYLTAIMTKTPRAGAAPVAFSDLDDAAREKVLDGARRLTGAISPGLDLTHEICSLFDQRIGDTVIVGSPDALEGFALCHTGPGSEGGSGLCYVKFGAARSSEAFDRLLAACEAFAASRGVPIEAGVNLAREGAYRRMRAAGYLTMRQGVAMQQPHEPGFNRPDAYVIDDWR